MYGCASTLASWRSTAATDAGEAADGGSGAVAVKGCGCGVGAGPEVLGALALLAVWRRRRAGTSVVRAAQRERRH